MGAALAAAMLVVGCAKIEGEKFVGHWVNVQSQDDVMDIEHNGKSFMVRSTTPKLFSRQPKTDSYPGRRAAGQQRQRDGQLCHR